MLRALKGRPSHLYFCFTSGQEKLGAPYFGIGRRSKAQKSLPPLNSWSVKNLKPVLYFNYTRNCNLRSFSCSFNHVQTSLEAFPTNPEKPHCVCDKPCYQGVCVVISLTIQTKFWIAIHLIFIGYPKQKGIQEELAQSRLF